MSARLFVGNLPYDTTETDLRELFSPIGSLSTVIIPTDRDTGKPRGFAFVEFDDPDQAAEASRQLNNKIFRGRAIAINEARAKESHSYAGPGRRSGYPMNAAGVDRRLRSDLMRRPSTGSNDFPPDPERRERSFRAGKRSRNFGPNAKPSRKRKSRYGSENEMGGRKGPIRERVGGRFFGSYEDDLYEDDQELDYMADFRDSDEEGAV